MEQYTGVKFKNIVLSYQLEETFKESARTIYNVYYLLSKFGCVDFYEGGASGNISIKHGDKILITKSGYNPLGPFKLENFCVIENVDTENKVVYSVGKYPPSSEAILHSEIYKRFNVGAVIHWHNTDMAKFLEELGIQSTKNFYEYGTLELAISAVELLNATKDKVIFLKNHGFISIGDNIIENYTAIKELLKKLMNFIDPLFYPLA